MPDIAVTDQVAPNEGTIEVLVEDTAHLRRLAREAADSGPGLDAEEVFARLEARYADPPEG
jgi:hypothetical protein